MKKYICYAAAAAMLLFCACTADNTSVVTSDHTSQQTTAQTETESQPDAGGESSESEASEPDFTVEMSANSGFYDEEFELILSCGDVEILYTLDGSDPSTSATATAYTAPITISDRRGEKNVLSAVDPLLIAGSFNEANHAGDGFVCSINAPEDSAVDKCTVVRAAARKLDGSFGEEAHATYFIGTPEEHIDGIAQSCAAAGAPLAVISLSADYGDFFDNERGIYVKGNIFDEALSDYLTEEKRVREGETARKLDANYKQRGREWERKAAISMLEVLPDGSTEVISQICGVRTQGNYSRSDLQKGLRLYARSDYGTKRFEYAVFGEDYLDDGGEVMDTYKTLVLRAGGNCAFLAKFNDAYWQTLCRGLDVETKRSRPCVVYLNGEYWGLYILEEDYSADRLEKLHGIDEKDIVIYKGDAEALELGYKLDEGKLPEGVSDEKYYFSELLEFFASHTDLKSDEDYAEFEGLVDVDSVMDYFAAEIWMNNKWDWPGKNWSMWRTLSVGEGYSDGRWRFLMYDVEFGGIGGEWEAGANTIKEDNYKPYGLLDKDTDNPAVLCFAYLMTNDGFRERFCDKLSSMSENEFEQSHAMETLDKFTDIYSPLYEQFFARYPETGTADNAVNGGYGSPACIRAFFGKRSGNIGRMIKYCEKTLAS